MVDFLRQMKYITKKLLSYNSQTYGEKMKQLTSCYSVLSSKITYLSRSILRQNKFKVIPHKYKQLDPCEELKKYINSENQPLLKIANSLLENKQNDVDLDNILSISACLEAIGDHKNSVEVFKIGQKKCKKNEEIAKNVYDWLYAAMYYWLFREKYKTLGCMAQAEQYLNEFSNHEYEELKRRILTYTPSAWITDEDIEDPRYQENRFRI